jgi:hypothetical protein
MAVDQIAMWRTILLSATALLALMFVPMGIVLTGAALDDLYLSPDDPAIEYSTRPTHDPIAELNRKIQQGHARLKFDAANGYLRPLLDTLGIPVESQLAVFSKTSFQTEGIGPHNPRSIFFNDSVAVAWLRGAWTLEVAAEDPEQGVVFYIVDQMFSEKPVFHRRDDCLTCHNSYNAAGVPGMLVRSVFTGRDGRALFQLGSYNTDHSSPMEQRWGGWYVTGKSGGAAHMGNTLVMGAQAEAPAEHELASLDGKIDTGGYLSRYSDIVALMVFEHQMRAINLLTRLGWEARYAAYRKTPLAPDAPVALADYMLFLDEAPLKGRIEGSSGFDRKFAAEGPRDSKGRSLRQFDLERRLMRYPCSYMIYSAAFDALPAAARDAVYQRMWAVLSGKETGERYARLTDGDRQAVIEILRETKPGLPKYFRD